MCFLGETHSFFNFEVGLWQFRCIGFYATFILFCTVSLHILNGEKVINLLSVGYWNVVKTFVNDVLSLTVIEKIGLLCL